MADIIPQKLTNYKNSLYINKYIPPPDVHIKFLNSSNESLVCENDLLKKENDVLKEEIASLKALLREYEKVILQA